MAYGYELGRLYNRRADIRARFGGQQQGGIITPSRHPLVIMISGEGGQTHGYADRTRPDGVFEYFDEGQVGNMIMARGNAAIANHAARDKSLLLFRSTNGGLRFDGEWVYSAHHYEEAPDTLGNLRQAIVFELVPIENLLIDDIDFGAESESLAELRKLAFLASKEVVETSQGARTIYQRSNDVRRYVSARAAGSCEGCGSPASFRTKQEAPYLEPHHLRRLSDGGPDDPRFMIALCPTCHRRGSLCR